MVGSTLKVGAYSAKLSAAARVWRGSIDKIFPSACSASRAIAGSSQAWAKRVAATRERASSALNINGGSSKPAPSR